MGSECTLLYSTVLVYMILFSGVYVVVCRVPYNWLFLQESYLCENAGENSKLQTKQAYKFTASKGHAPFEHV